MPDSTDYGLSQSAPDLIASTGVNDPGSPWYTGLLQTALTTGGNVLAASLSGQTPVGQTTGAPGNTTARQQSNTTSPTKSILPWVLGGLGLVLVVWYIARGR